MTEAGRACSSVVAAGRACSSVVEAGRACSSVVEAGRACSSVVEAGWACSSVAEAGWVGDSQVAVAMVRKVAAVRACGSVLAGGKSAGKSRWGGRWGVGWGFMPEKVPGSGGFAAGKLVAVDKWGRFAYRGWSPVDFRWRLT
ncbi:hypothetical protein GCM10009789_31400 [Kribbella sancticallisti]|uniref:Uncharacterized protein n=1 Tax=Kribbella sancticallisti TaxID=460087 RepID=A0ABN2DGH6_9ACTN